MHSRLFQPTTLYKPMTCEHFLSRHEVRNHLNLFILLFQNNPPENINQIEICIKHEPPYVKVIKITALFSSCNNVIWTIWNLSFCVCQISVTRLCCYVSLKYILLLKQSAHVRSIWPFQLRAAAEIRVRRCDGFRLWGQEPLTWNVTALNWISRTCGCAYTLTHKSKTRMSSQQIRKSDYDYVPGSAPHLSSKLRVWTCFKNGKIATR